MLHTTTAIVLKTIRHGDRTVVLKAYTEQFGLRAYLVRVGGRSGIPAAMLQALNRVEMVVEEHPDRDLQKLREIRVNEPYHQVPYDVIRGTLALFVQEVLYKVLRGEAHDPELYIFLHEGLEAMDLGQETGTFPLIFLLRLSAFLGFHPAAPAHGEDRFDLKEGEFIKGAAPHGHTLGPRLSARLAELLNKGFDEPLPTPIPAAERRELLDHLLLYYRMHIEGLGDLRSPRVLQQVFA